MRWSNSSCGSSTKIKLRNALSGVPMVGTPRRAFPTEAMQKLQGIAVSPGIAIGEALVMDTEGFRIPRRFVARDAVDDELERLEKADRRGVGRDFRQSRRDCKGTGREVRRHLRRPPADAPGLPHAGRTGGHDPPPALLARIRREPHPAALCAGLPAAGKQAPGGTGVGHFRHRKAAPPPLAGPPPRGIAHLTSPVLVLAHNLTPSETANLDRAVRPRLRHRDRRAGQPHGDRGRGPGDPRRRRHRPVPGGCLRRRAGHHRRRQGTGDRPARRRDAGALPPGRGAEPHDGRPAGGPPRPARSDGRRRAHQHFTATSSFPTK